MTSRSRRLPVGFSSCKGKLYGETVSSLVVREVRHLRHLGASVPRCLFFDVQILMSETTILPLTQELTSDLTDPTFIPVGSSYGPAGYLQAVIPRDLIERLPEPKVVIDKSKVFDLERECQATLSRLNYGLEATVTYEKLMMRKMDKAPVVTSGLGADGQPYLAVFPHTKEHSSGLLDRFYSPSVEPNPLKISSRISKLLYGFNQKKNRTV